MKKKILSGLLTLCLLFSSFSFMIPFAAVAANTAADGSDGEIIEVQDDYPLHLYYDEEASHGVDSGYDEVSASFGSGSSLIEAHVNDDWERWSIPLGNGYFGANVFGRTETERIQLTEKTLANPYRINNDSSLPTDGLNNFSETYIDFGHTNSAVTDYSRELDLRTAISTVSYVYGGVTYTREYFTSYPDKAMVIRLDASEAGALDFVLRPTVPYEQEYMAVEGDRGGKTGTVTSSVAEGVGEIILSGTLEYFDIDFVGIYNVYTDGGTVTATTCTNSDGDTDGTVTVSGATSAYIVITMGTDYELCSETFTESATTKPTFSTTLDDAMAKVEGYMASVDGVISGKSFDDAYAALKYRHLADYQELFGRVALDLECQQSDAELTTDVLLENYKNGSGSTYLEVLYFQYGRYLLIASSRSGALPANLQGTWNRYNNSPWSSGYWHNINVQMNYWPAFSTNLSETFEAYVDYNAAYMEKAQSGATSYVKTYNSALLGTDGGNGWSIATGGYVSDVYSATSIGNLGFTTQLFWEYYAYSGDEELLREVVYPVLVDAARFITKMVKQDADGNYIAVYSDSPEQYVNGVWYYTDKGTAYAQSFAYQNNYNALLAAKELGIDFEDESGEDYEILQTIMEQLDKYDPIRIGLSGQVKEFFEEEYYGDMGEYTHRHISQLVGLYPGNVINGTTTAWLDAAEYTLTERGDKATGWGVAHRLNLWARVQNGERAHDLLNQLLSANTATNLWDLHPPFQIDGNLGGTSGISEMLLQSHAGYIEPLAAIPDAWSDGSYTGLVARGNFVVGAKWADGVATCFNITSQNGGEVSVKYDGISDSVVTTAAGTVVPYTAKDGIITFNTVAGETYIISGFEKIEAPEKPEGLEIESNFLSTSTLTWSASSDAASYNVYVAKDSEPTYTFLASTRGNSYVYTPEALENDRLTFAVTAVNAYGVESDRALAYRNPDDTSSQVESVAASIVDGELQVAIESNDYAGVFNLYSRANAVSEWVLVEESTYPVIIYANYDASVSYGVSVRSLFGEESEITAISPRTGTGVEKIDYQPSNILLNAEFNPTATALNNVHAAAYGYATLTDGSMDSTTGRFSTKTASGMVFDATVSLPTTFLLGEVRIFDFSAYDTACNYMGESITIEVMYEGEWTEVASCSTNADILTHRTKTASGTKYISFDLTGVMAQAVRVYIPNSYNSNSISIYEIECSGVAIPNSKSYSDNLFLGCDVSLTEASKKHVNPASGDESKLTDGILATSTSSDIWYTWYNQTDMEFDGTIYLGGDAFLGSLRIYDYRAEATLANSVGPQIIIQVYNDGVWTTVSDVTIVGGSGNNINQYRKSGTRENSIDGTTEYWLEFDLGYVKAQAVRIYMPPKSTQNFGMYEIECDGYISKSAKLTVVDNIFEGLQFVPTAAAEKVIWGTNTYDKATDGLTGSSNRLATSGTSSFVDGTLSFEGAEAYLDTLTIDYGSSYTQARSGTGLVIQVYSDGAWTDALNLAYDRAYRGEVTYDLGHVKASRVRLYVPGVYPDAYADESLSLTAGDCIVIEEISCTGMLISVDKTWSDNLLEGYAFEAGPDAGAIWSPHTYDKITDGETTDTTRFSTTGNAAADGILDFGGETVELYTLAITYSPNNAKRCGADITIQVYRDGAWQDVVTYVHETTTSYLELELNGVVAEKLRFKISGMHSEGDCTQIYEMTCSGYFLPKESTAEDTGSNILLGTENSQITISGATTHAAFTDKEYQLFDGDLSTRHAVGDSSPYAYSVEVDLNGTYPLYTMLIYPFANSGEASRSDNTSVEIYLDGVWFTVASGITVEPTSGAPTTISLGGIEASKLRINFANTTWAACASIYEITCTTGAMSATDRKSLLEAYRALDDMDVSGTFGLEEVKSARLAELKALLADTEADQAAIDEYVSTVTSAAEELEAGAPVTDDYGDFTQYNLSLEGDISFNFYGELAEDITTTFPSGFVYVEYSDGTAERHLLSDLKTADNGMQMLSLNLAAAEMTDVVRLRLILDGSNCGEVIEQSVRSYSEALLGNEAYAESYGLINAMLNYGAYAQLYFGYNTDNLANAGIDSTLEAVTENASIGITGSATGLSLASWTLALEHEVEAKIYFTLQSDVNINAFTVSVTTPGGESYEASVESFGTRYRIVVKNIGAGYLDDSYTVRFTNNVDGTYVDLTLSAMCYVSQVLANENSPETLKALVRALRIYSDAADAYQGNS